MTDQPDRTAPTAALPASGYVLLALLTVFWGVNWPVMKIALGEMSVWWFRSACLIFSGGGLLAIAAMTGSPLFVRKHEVLPLLATMVFAILGWHIFAGFGVTLMPAGRASIIAYTMPVWAALFGAWLLGERFTAIKIVGLALGVAGLAILIGPDIVAFGSAPLGALLMLGAAVTWAFGTVLFKRFSWSIPVAANMGWQLVIAAVPITIVAIIDAPPPSITALSPAALWSMIYVLTLPMLFGQWAYFQIVKLFPASIAAIGTLAVPVVGVLSSAWMLGEPIGWRDITAVVLICSALAVILVLPHFLQRRSV